MRTIKATHWNRKSTDVFNDDTFTFMIPNRPLARTGYILDCDEDGMILMQKSACLKSHYTEKDHADRARLNAMTPILTGDTVIVNGQEYLVTIKGDYSEAGYLTAI